MTVRCSIHAHIVPKLKYAIVVSFFSPSRSVWLFFVSRNSQRFYVTFFCILLLVTHLFSHFSFKHLVWIAFVFIFVSFGSFFCISHKRRTTSRTKSSSERRRKAKKIEMNYFRLQMNRFLMFKCMDVPCEKLLRRVFLEFQNVRAKFMSVVAKKGIDE